MTTKTKILLAMIAVALTTYAFVDRPPRPSRAASDSDTFIMYAISDDTNTLVAYDMDSHQTRAVGAVVSDATGATLAGITTAAYIPRSSHLIGFWTDPADGQSKILYINLSNASARVVGQPLGDGAITGATAVMPTAPQTLPGSKPTPLTELMQGLYSVYALQTVAPQEVEKIDFVIDKGNVVPAETFAAKVKVLGAAISSGGDPMPVTLKVKIGDSTFEPFGSYSNAANGDVNDGKNPRSYILPNTFAPGTKISITGKSWTKETSGKGSRRTTTYNGYLSADSGANSPQVLVLRDGDSVPNIKPFENQSSITAFVGDYIDTATKKIKLEENQAIYLFELGTTNLTSTAADFQDLVVLVTLGKSTSELSLETQAQGADDATPEPTSRLIKVDHKTGTLTSVMDLSREYHGLAAIDAQLFYAMSGDDLYVIDPVAGTETRLGTSSATDVMSVEFAGSKLMGYDDATNHLNQMNTNTAANVGEGLDLNLSSLRGIIFARKADVPYVKQFD